MKERRTLVSDAIPFEVARHYFYALCQRQLGYASGGRTCDVKIVGHTVLSS